MYKLFAGGNGTPETDDSEDTTDEDIEEDAATEDDPDDDYSGEFKDEE